MQPSVHARKVSGVPEISGFREKFPEVARNRRTLCGTKRTVSSPTHAGNDMFDSGEDIFGCVPRQLRDGLAPARPYPETPRVLPTNHRDPDRGCVSALRCAQCGSNP
eukprot:718109-Prorocentrum_minimum.AAC.4